MRRALLACLAVAAILVGGAQAATTLKIKADKAALKYDVRSLTAKAGLVTITMSNPSLLPHDVAIKGKGVKAKGKVVLKGGVSRVTAKLKRGTYTFYCSVPGHEAAGMKGTLKVR